MGQIIRVFFRNIPIFSWHPNISRHNWIHQIHVQDRIKVFLIHSVQFFNSEVVPKIVKITNNGYLTCNVERCVGISYPKWKIFRITSDHSILSILIACFRNNFTRYMDPARKISRLFSLPQMANLPNHSYRLLPFD